MKEQTHSGRGLEDISHYFITEKEEGSSENKSFETTEEKPVESSEVSVQAEDPAEADSSSGPLGQFYLLGSDSKEARSVLISNLACVLSLDRKPVQIIETENQIPSVSYLLGNVVSDNGENSSLSGSAPIELAAQQQKNETSCFAGKWGLWNLSSAENIQSATSAEESPRYVILLEPETKKLIQAYLELKQALLQRPDSIVYAVVYAAASEKNPGSVTAFFQKVARQYLNIEIRDGGIIQKDLNLAKSILSRTPLVLFSDQNNPIKKTIQELSEKLIQEAVV